MADYGYLNRASAEMSDRNPLDERQLEELLEAAGERRLPVDFTVRTLAFTGMRASELSHMRADWVDWTNEQVQVPAHEDCECSDCRSKAGQSDELAVGDYWRPKSSAGARSIPVQDPDAVRVMRDFFKRNEEVGVTRKTVWDRVRGMEEHVDFKRKIYPHHLRHTFGTIVAFNTEDPFFIKQVMGHADISSTQPYVEYTGSQLNEKAEGMWG